MLSRRSRSLLLQSRHDPDAFAAFYDAYAERVLIFLVRRVLDVDACGDIRRLPLVDVAHTADRTVYFGRARPGVRRVVAVVDGRRYPAPTGVGGAWLLVFRGRATLSSLTAG